MTTAASTTTFAVVFALFVASAGVLIVLTLRFLIRQAKRLLHTVEFMGEAGGEFPERGKFLLLFAHARGLADAVRDQTYETFPKNRRPMQHFREDLFVEACNM